MMIWDRIVFQPQQFGRDKKRKEPRDGDEALGFWFDGEMTSYCYHYLLRRHDSVTIDWEAGVEYFSASQLVL